MAEARITCRKEARKSDDALGPVTKRPTALRRPNTPVVLCVDDDPEVLKALRRSLRDGRFEVNTARGCEEAFDWLAELVVNLVVTDERMPGMLGADLLREVRKRSPRTARAFLSGFCSSEVIREGLEAGADTFLYNPWDDVVLRETIDRILKRALKGPRLHRKICPRQALLIEAGKERLPPRSSRGPLGPSGKVRMGRRRCFSEIR